jgi:hypothetical protein
MKSVHSIAYREPAVRQAVFDALDNMVANGYPPKWPYDQAIDLKTYDADLQDIDLDELLEYINQWLTTLSK